MVDTMNIPFKRKVAKEHHLRQEGNEFGSHDRFYFTPATDGKIRCFKCNRLFDSSLLDTGKCPNCLYEFTRSEAKDAYVESVYHKVNYGGWNDTLIQELAGTGTPSLVRPDGHVAPLTETAREVVKYYVAKVRQYAKEDNMPSEVYQMRTQALNASLSKPIIPRKL